MLTYLQYLSKSTECLFIDFRELIRTSFKFWPNRFLKLRFFIVARVLVKTHTDLYINLSKCPLNISKLLESGIQAGNKTAVLKHNAFTAVLVKNVYLAHISCKLVEIHLFHSNSHSKFLGSYYNSKNRVKMLGTG